MTQRVSHGWIVTGIVAMCPLWNACASRGGVTGEAKIEEEKLDGYAEWRSEDALIVDGQRVRCGPEVKFKGKGEALGCGTIPLGYEVKVEGVRTADGVVLAHTLEAKPNGSALFEKEVKSLTNEAEASYRRAGRFFQQNAAGKEETIGRLYESGPQVARVRSILNDLLPPYIPRTAVRVYVIENDEWNAFAMGNYSIYVFSGMLRDFDDDEVAVVLAHELVHASHEHTRRQFKKAMWVQLAALGVSLLAEDVDNKNKRAVVQLLAMFGAMTFRNGYGRGLEDQADRVGLRYAYEAGFNVTRGPLMWNRFAKKYGESGKVANFFFGDHSLSRQRAKHLERELRRNYPQGPKPGGRKASRFASPRRAM